MHTYLIWQIVIRKFCNSEIYLGKLQWEFVDVTKVLYGERHNHLALIRERRKPIDILICNWLNCMNNYVMYVLISLKTNFFKKMWYYFKEIFLLYVIIGSYGFFYICICIFSDKKTFLVKICLYPSIWMIFNNLV